MLRIGLTGGIGAGKSTVSRELVELGATLVDADLIAREVLAPGSPGLAEVLEAFGQDLVGPDGALDRPALAAVVFAEPVARARLNSIVHPRVGRETQRRINAAAPDAVLVQDIPLLVEGDMAPSFPLVVVVDAPVEERVHRLVHSRGMPEADARARIAAQVDEQVRRAAADVWLDNSGAEDGLRAELRRLWRDRLVPFERAVRLNRLPRRQDGELVEDNPRWPVCAERIGRRVARACGVTEGDVRHIGSTAVPGLIARDVLDLQLVVPAGVELAAALRAVGFLRAGEAERFSSADPGSPVDLYVRRTGSVESRRDLLLRDWLRTDAPARTEYGAVKRHAGGSGYPAAKRAWFDAALDSAERWARGTGWSTPEPGQATDVSERAQQKV